ncbi:MAG: hypothetical protein ACRCS9_06940, partial [Hyphomicrobium sp.]
SICVQRLTEGRGKATARTSAGTATSAAGAARRARHAKAGRATAASAEPRAGGCDAGCQACRRSAACCIATSGFIQPGLSNANRCSDSCQIVRTATVCV